MEATRRERRRKLSQNKETRKTKHYKIDSKTKMETDVLECASGEERSSFERLSHAYRCLENGSRPSMSAGALASIIVVGACKVCDEDGGDVELACVSMTLVRKITSSLMARSLPPSAASYFAETLKILIHEMDLMSHLVSGSLQMLCKSYAMLSIQQTPFCLL